MSDTAALSLGEMMTLELQRRVFAARAAAMQASFALAAQLRRPVSVRSLLSFLPSFSLLVRVYISSKRSS